MMPNRPYRALLSRYLQPQWPRVALLAVLMGSGIALELLNPQIVRYFIDTAQSGGAQTNLLRAAAAFLTIALISRLMALATDYTVADVGWRATNALRSDLALHCLRLDMPFHKRHTPGELIERIDGDVTRLAGFFSQFTIRVLGNAILVVGILLLLMRENLWVGIGLTAYAAISLWSLAALQNLAVTRWAADRQTQAELFGFLEERISATEDIQTSGAEPYMMSGLATLLERSLEKSRAAGLASHVAEAITTFLFVLGNALGLGLGAYLYLQGQVTIGSAFLIVYYIGNLAGPIQGIRRDAQDLQQATASMGRIGGLFEQQPLVRDVESAPSPTTSGPPRVTFQSVSFGYGDEADGSVVAPPELGANRLVLQDVSFDLPPGRVLGILGRTGSGKTTLSRLVFRLYDASGGAILLDGLPLATTPLAELRRRVGMVTQDVQLFQATLRDNLTFFASDISDEHIELVLKRVRLWDWVQTLPHGLDTKLSGGGQGLSAGEAQLLAFARIFLRDPGLVVLDEASSRLDPVTQGYLERAMDHLLHDRTCIIIAHRLSTVARADDILILDNGAVAEYGPRVRLAEDRSSRFHHLLQTGLEEALA